MKALDEKMESVVCISLYCSVCFSCFVWLLPIGSFLLAASPPCPLGWSLGAFWSNQFSADPFSGYLVVSAKDRREESSTGQGGVRMQL